MAKPVMVVLHGLNSCAAEMAPLVRAMADFDVRVPDLLGHGGRPVPERLRVEAIVEDLADWLDREAIGPAHFIGYSFGGYIGLGLALRHSQRLRSLTLLAVKFRWDAEGVAHVVHLTAPDRLARPGNARAEQMAAAHGAEQWRAVTLANREMIAAFGAEGAPIGDRELARIETSCLVLTGEDDPLVSGAESGLMVDLLPVARLGLWPGLAHPLVNVPLVEVKHAVSHFTAEVEAGTFVPGPPLRLARRLVEGGTGMPELRVRIRPLRRP